MGEIKEQYRRKNNRDTLLKKAIKDCDRLFKKFKDNDYLKLKKMYQKQLKEL